VDRTETAIPTQIAQPASSGVNTNWTSTCVRVDRRNDHGMGEQSRSGEKDPKDRVRDHERRNHA
jgi:hypothetical protein